MSDDAFDTPGSMTWIDGLPQPDWDLIESWVESRFEATACRDVWDAIAKRWLATLGQALGGGYETIESEHFQALVPHDCEVGRQILRFAERCRLALLSSLNGVADVDSWSKSVVVVLRNPDDYYRYISLYFPEGEHGGSSGVHIRVGYPHVALHGEEQWTLENILAHELTHVALHHLCMPQWLEEGLAQMVEHNMAGRALLTVDAEMVKQHKRYWGRHGLDLFWCGEGFSQSGKVQALSYQLAEILVRLLVEDGRPRWFGLVREPQIRFFAFLREANISDSGEAACRAHLGYELSELAAKFLGAGTWTPGR
jgi:hypothetical protein